jgi:4-amino-4-deoxy-L-arabinose transferase-like glycosyltransferase
MIKFKNKFKFLKNKYFWIFIAIVLLGIFLRAYNFTPWLHFELDQSRDATLIREAIEGGPGDLPLLGPRAAGTFLRLGPAFYYIEYAFSWIFGATPQGSAYAILFFAVLALPALYLLFRRYFSNKLTLALLTVFSTSLFMVTYARFSWNPNMLPFFVVIFLWIMLKVVDIEEDKKRGYWLLLAATVFGILAQFHFLALIILSITAAFFILYKRPRIKPLFWGLSILIFALLHFPAILNDIKTGGDNAELFIEAVTDKSDSDKDYALLEKVSENYSEHTLKYWIMITGSQTAEVPDLDVVANNNLDIKCDQECRDNLFKGVLAFGFFTLGIIVFLFELFREKDVKKRDFLVLNAILFLVSFGVFTPLAFDISPRFFLIVTPLPFIFLGLVIKRLGKILKFKNFAWIVATILVAFNLYFTVNFLIQLNNAEKKFFDIGKDRILKQKTRITLEQEMAIADYMENFYLENKYPVFYKGQSEFHRAFAYILDGRKVPRDGISKSKICRQGNYFLIIRTQSDINNYLSYFRKFDLLEEKLFGTLRVFHLTPKQEAITCEKPDQSKFRNYKGEGGSVAKRYIWNEIFEEDQK